MKKILSVLMVLLLLIACSGRDEYALGVYKGRNYQNSVFDLKFDILDNYAFLDAKELKIENDKQTEASKDPEQAKFHNKVLDISNTAKTTLVAYVDSSDKEKNPILEANNYIDFLSDQNINYKLTETTETIKDLDYVKFSLDLDFNKSQIVLVTLSQNKLINIQITYDTDKLEEAEALIEMLKQNE